MPPTSQSCKRPRVGQPIVSRNSYGREPHLVSCRCSSYVVSCQCSSCLVSRAKRALDRRRARDYDRPPTCAAHDQRESETGRVLERVLRRRCAPSISGGAAACPESHALGITSPATSERLLIHGHAQSADKTTYACGQRSTEASRLLALDD